MNEKAVENYLKKRINLLGGSALKFISPGFNGVPDRIILMPHGRIYFAETKAPKKKLGKLQNYVCEKIRNLGFTVVCLDTKEKIDLFIESEVKPNGV